MGGFRLAVRVQATTSGLRQSKAPGALDGPGLLLVKRNFRGDIEHYFFGY